MKETETPYAVGKEKYYNNRKCIIIQDSGHIYFTIIKIEDNFIPAA